MAYKVFISHSSRDTWVAEQIERHLHECGAETFLDERNIAIGDDFEDVIFNEIGDSNEIVVLMTPWALKRPYIWLEIGAARSRGIRIVAIIHGILLADLQKNPNIPALIKKRDIVEINDLGFYFL